MRSVVLVCVALLMSASACNNRGRRRGDHGDGGTTTTMPTIACSTSKPCPTGDICFNSFCIPNNGTCNTDDNCENDTFCDCGGTDAGEGPCTNGTCVPWGDPPRGANDPTCSAGFSVGAFQAPSVKCQWKAPIATQNSQVIMTPVVIDLDGDQKPEIIFTTQDGTMYAIHGADCTQLWTVAGMGFGGFAQLATADLDGDGQPEIVALTATTIVVLDHTGAKLASGPYTPRATSSNCDGPAIADVDNVAPPEIVVEGAVYRYVKGQPALTKLFSNAPVLASWGLVPAFADLDGDGKPEVIAGLKIYNGVSGADKTPTAMSSLPSPTVGAYSAIADFNGDGKPDIVSVQSGTGQQQVSIVDFANNKVIFGPYKVADGGWGGPPTVGDYDGDGVPDFGLASKSNYYVYALKCAKTPKPVDCTGTDPGVLWERPTHDTSSGGTASSTFDFNGDGIAEVVYRDECWLRVYNGPNGKAIFAKNITSGTCLEYPVIADVDNDGHADLVVPSDNVQESFTNCPTTPEIDTNTPWSGYTTGIFVLQDPMNRWLPSRPLWTQHTYHVTEINDDFSVPTDETPSWTVDNTYRKNVQGKLMGAGGIDATGGEASNSGCTSDILAANICDRGAATIPSGMSGTFYTSDPRQPGATVICTVMTTAPIMPGMCEEVQCTWPSAPTTSTGVWFRANDNGTMQNIDPECKAGNDLLYLPPGSCGPVK